MNGEHIFENNIGFLDTVRFQAEWRGRKDDRNLESAEGLDQLAAWIEANPKAEVLVALDQVLDRLYADPDISFSFEPSITQRLGRYCFGTSDEPEIFLFRLVTEIRKHLEHEPAAEIEAGRES